MTRVIGPPKSRRRRWTAVWCAAVALGVGLVFIPGALAVHDLSFQLDGDVIASTTTTVPPVGTTGSHTELIDWDSIFTSAGANQNPLPAGFTAAGFDIDFVNNSGSFGTSDSTTFATGSKDTLPISGWQCNADSNVNSKIDIMNSYAAAFTAANGDQVLYFGLERNANTGDANVGFWFLQDNVGCTSPGGSVTFTGEHRDGDLLIVSAFTNGGTVSTIDVYRWDRFTGTCPGVTCVLNPPGVPGSLNTTPVAHGVDCRDSTNTSLNDTACAVSNTTAITTPWLTANKQDGVGNNLRTSEFFEGGLNLTKANLAGRCFNVFIGDTRSSQSLTATLFDFARGSIGECTSKTETTPSITSAAIPADPADATVTVTDDATVTVTGASSFSGTVTWHLCGPFAASSATLCGSGGVAAGSQAVTTSPQTVTSDTMTVTAAGRYCWRADFSSTTADVPPSSDSRASECFVITPRQPTLTTQATTGPVDFGQKISDTVTLSNTAHKPGTGGPAGSELAGSINPTTLGGDATGDITVVAFGPDSCSTVAFTSAAIAASGDGSKGGAGTAFEFQPSAPGQYVFVGAYAGDLPNTLAIAATACSGAPASEKVTVRQIPTHIKTKQSWIPNDTATVSADTGNLAAGGTVAFSLYNNATCTGTALYSQTVNIVGGNPTEEVSTTNTGGATGFTITTGYADAAGSIKGPFSWKVVYTPAVGDTAHTGTQSSCDAEHFSVTYTNDPGPN